MARTYLIRGPATFADGDPLDAWTTRTRIQKNLEAIYEEARIDQFCVLQAPEEISTAAPSGPFPIWMRRDRDQSWRTPRVQPLFCAGTGNIILRAILTPAYYRPTGFPSAPDEQPYLDWTVGAGTTPAWQTAKSFTLPSWWGPVRRDLPEGDELGSYRIAWLTFWTTTPPPGPANPRLCGFRFIETVDDEP